MPQDFHYETNCICIIWFNSEQRELEEQERIRKRDEKAQRKRERMNEREAKRKQVKILIMCVCLNSKIARTHFLGNYLFTCSIRNFTSVGRHIIL